MKKTANVDFSLVIHISISKYGYLTHTHTVCVKIPAKLSYNLIDTVFLICKEISNIGG